MRQPQPRRLAGGQTSEGARRRRRSGAAPSAPMPALLHRRRRLRRQQLAVIWRAPGAVAGSTARNRPSSSTATRRGRRSTSSNSWLARTIVSPPARRRSRCASTRSRVCGSRPTKGSVEQQQRRGTQQRQGQTQAAHPTAGQLAHRTVGHRFDPLTSAASRCWHRCGAPRRRNRTPPSPHQPADRLSRGRRRPLHPSPACRPSPPTPMRPADGSQPAARASRVDLPAPSGRPDSHRSRRTAQRDAAQHVAPAEPQADSVEGKPGVASAHAGSRQRPGATDRCDRIRARQARVPPVEQLERRAQRRTSARSAAGPAAPRPRSAGDRERRQPRRRSSRSRYSRSRHCRVRRPTSVRA